jgi:copper chaperone CopZ
MTTTTYLVAGMTCGHCAAAVTKEIAALPGVAGVTVDLEDGTATVTGDVAADEVAAAVDEAGYAVTGTR